MTPIIAGLNHVLNQSPWARTLLQAHSGACVLIDATPITLRLTIDAQGLTEAAASDAAPSVTLRVPFSQLPLFLTDRARAMREVRIEGDVELAQTLSRLVKELRPDIEEDLSRVVGDVAAVHLTSAAREMEAYARDAATRVGEMVSAYLVDEDRALIKPFHLQPFVEDVTTLRDDVARLEARIALLEATRKTN
jgi:ubiquinone biosynthesis accessory factor UbiJ